MTILMYIPSLGSGGAERVFVNLANSFLANNCRVIFVSSSMGVYGLDLNENVEFIPFKAKINSGNRKLSLVANFIYDVFGLRQIIRSENPDIFISTLALGNLKAFFANTLAFKGAKLVLRQANVLNTFNRNRFVNYFLRKAFSHADLVIANSYDTKESVLSLDKGNENLESKIKVIGNPVFDETIVEKAEVGRDLSFLKYGKFILNVGRFTPEKDHLFLLNSYKLLLEEEKIDMVLLGEGPLETEIRDKILELKIQDSVHLLGFVKNPYFFYKNAEIFALSSKTEGFGNVLVEALSFGTPVISTHCKGGPSYILDQGKFGSLIPLGDLRGYANEMVRIIKSVQKKDDKLIDRAKSFSVVNVSKLYLLEFNLLLKHI